jgi:hypothetical protein
VPDGEEFAGVPRADIDAAEEAQGEEEQSDHVIRLRGRPRP